MSLLKNGNIFSFGGKLEHSALQDELSKERQALENAHAKAQLLEEKEQENSKLLSQLKQLQVEYFFLLFLNEHVWHFDIIVFKGL